MPRALEHRPFRPEIQGLRAIAVTAVLCFHALPFLLPGGYIGVDVFFVISGYLITGHLFREACSEGTISLPAFYARRIKRLLPTAVLVLIIVACATPLLPETRWDETSVQIAASSVFVENWTLAQLATDYLGSQNPASPVQHFWSLSVEEQFYFVWPILIVATIAIGKRLHWSLRFTAIATLGAIFGASLVCSLVLTAAEPAAAYFFMHTRIWELALGGLLALGEGRWLFGVQSRAIAGLVGLGAIIGASALFSSHTAFPGAAALVPTIGAVLVIFAADAGGMSAWSLLKSWPLQYLGDRSYSIYLWHWPLLIFTGVFLGRALTWIDGLTLVIITLVVAHVSFSLVETPFWKGRFKTSAVAKPLGLGFTGILACLLAAGTVFYIAERPGPRLIDANYPGPRALFANVSVPKGVEPIPALTRAKNDLPIVYRLGCHQDQKHSEPLSCSFGAPTNKASLNIVVAGDSHAAQWIPALRALAQKKGWSLTTFTKSACPLARALVTYKGKIYASCAEWQDKVMDSIKAIHPDLVITSQERGYTLAHHASMVDGLKDVWSDLVKHGIRVIAIRDTPRMAKDPADCLAQSLTNCATLRRDAIKVSDPVVLAAEGMQGVRLVDMTSAICGDKYCEPLVGNILVWRDTNHLTATYAAALENQFVLRTGLDKSSGWSARAALRENSSFVAARRFP